MSTTFAEPTTFTFLQLLEEAPQQIRIARQGPVDCLCAGLVVHMLGSVAILHHRHPLLVPVDEAEAKADAKAIAR